jgi:hypothetical protein
MRVRRRRSRTATLDPDRFGDAANLPMLQRCGSRPKVYGAPRRGRCDDRCAYATTPVDIGRGESILGRAFAAPG